MNVHPKTSLGRRNRLYPDSIYPRVERASPGSLPGREVIEIYRRSFAIDPACFVAQGNWRQRFPQGFRLEPVGAGLAEQVGVLASWASVADFLANGIGFVLLDGDKIVSACTNILPVVHFWEE